MKDLGIRASGRRYNHSSWVNNWLLYATSISMLKAMVADQIQEMMLRSLHWKAQSTERTSS